MYRYTNVKSYKYTMGSLPHPHGGWPTSKVLAQKYTNILINKYTMGPHLQGELLTSTVLPQKYTNIQM